MATGHVPTWARATVYLGGAVVGGGALAASGFDLYGLGVALGFVYGTALAVPIGLDAGAVVSGVRWITAAPDSDDRTRWRRATLGLVAASAVLNGLSVLAADHWIPAALQPIDDVGLLAGPVAVGIAVVVASAFPLVAAWMVHAVLEVRDAAARDTRPGVLRDGFAAAAEWVHVTAQQRRERRADRRDTPRGTRPAEAAEPSQPAEVGATVPEDVRPSREPSPQRPTDPGVVPAQVSGQDGDGRPGDGEIVARLAVRDSVPGIGAIASEFGIGKTRAARLQGRATRERDGQTSSSRDVDGSDEEADQDTPLAVTT